MEAMNIGDVTPKLPKRTEVANPHQGGRSHAEKSKCDKCDKCDTRRCTVSDPHVPNGQRREVENGMQAAVQNLNPHSLWSHIP